MTDKTDTTGATDPDGPDQDPPAPDNPGSEPKAGTRSTPPSAAHKEPSEAPGAKPGATKTAPAGRPAKAGAGRWAVWLVVVVMVAGGAVAAAWPVVGPRVMPLVEPYWAQARDVLGLTPRPTEAQLPPESLPQPEPQAEPQPEPQPESQPQPETPLVPDISRPIRSEPMPKPVPGPVSDAAALGALAVRLNDLENRLNALPAPDDGPALAALQNQMADIAQRLAAVEAAQAELAARPRDLTAPAQALVLAAAQLRARLSGDGPFDAELAALEQIAKEDSVVMDIARRLRPHAKIGVPSEAALIARYASVASDIMRARAKGDAGWLGQVKEGLGGLITVRRTDPREIADDVERAVAVAEAALELGELAKAVEALDQLQGPAAEAAAAWLGDAHARVQADRALDDLHRHALAVLAAAGGA